VKYWPHFTAVLKETKTGQKYAVDSWLFDQGENPAESQRYVLSRVTSGWPGRARL
jgi:hypothetical protein